MGWDLRIFIEYFVDDRWQTAPFDRRRGPGRSRTPDVVPVHPSRLRHRDADLAALTTGWHPRGAERPRPIAPSRGGPPAASATVRGWVEVEAPFHDELTWATAAEILAYPHWDEELPDARPPALGLAAYAEGLERGFDARVLRTDREQQPYYPHEHRVSSAEIERWIDGLGGPRAAREVMRSRESLEAAERARAHGGPASKRVPLATMSAPPPRWDSRVRGACASLLDLVNETVAQIGGDPARVRFVFAIEGR